MKMFKGVVGVKRRIWDYLLVALLIIGLAAFVVVVSLRQDAPDLSNYQVFYGSKIDSIEAAKEFALAFSKVAPSEVEFELEEFDPSKKAYIFEYGNDNRSYSCQIDSENGIIEKYEFDGTLPSFAMRNDIMGQEEICAIVMAIDPTVNRSSILMHMDKFDDDNLTVYEGEATGEEYFYKFEFHVSSGLILEWSTAKVK
jgi:hypothetical protein